MTQPHPDRWLPATLVLVPGDHGHHGTLTYDGVTVYVRKWVQPTKGVVKAELQWAGDGWVEREILGDKP